MRDNILNECWEWQGSRLMRSPYGVKNLNGRQYLTHRLAYAWAYGPIPEGMHVCHRCDNPPCCNPRHLFLGTARDNMRDCVAKGRFRTGGSFGPGEEHRLAKLTTAAVLAIRASDEPRLVLSRRHGVAPRTIWAIRRRITWSHI